MSQRTECQTLVVWFARRGYTHTVQVPRPTCSSQTRSIAHMRSESYLPLVLVSG